jgi:hypothetical protein
MKIAEAMIRLKEPEQSLEEEEKKEDLQASSSGDRYRVDTEEEQQNETQAVQNMLKKVFNFCLFMD